jgi:DNA-binding protein YbaB
VNRNIKLHIHSHQSNKSQDSNMKLSILSTALLISGASAFAPSHNARTTSTSLNLFGGKKEGGGDGGGGMGGMMDQLAMFKKAQEIAKKKQDLDQQIAEMEIIGSAADGNIKVTVQYVPAQMPANPSPGYDAVAIDIDEAYLNDVSSEDLSTSLVEALRNGEESATKVVAEKYQSLDKELSGMLGGMAGGPPAE